MKAFAFIPEYDLEEGNLKKTINKSQREIFKIKSLTQPQRVLFFAICQYFEKNDFNEEAFKDWLRVVCNLIETPEIDTVDSMISRIKLIHKLSDYSRDIISEMSEDNVTIDSDVAKDQLKEEIIKAKKLKPKDSAWEERIRDAECTAFFNGAIRFLYGGNAQEDWDNFDTKYKHAQEYFNENGVQESYNKDVKLFRRLLSHFNEWDQWCEITFGNSAEDWKKCLLNNNLNTPISNLLQDNDIQDFKFEPFSYNYIKEDEEYAEQKKYTIELLIKEKDTLLENVLASGRHRGLILKFKEWNFDADQKGVYCIAPKGQGNHNQKNYLVLNKRLELLSKLSDQIKIPGSKGMYIPGQNIDFEYKNKQFIWKIVSDDADVYIKIGKDANGKGFKWEKDMDLLNRLDGIISNQMQGEKQ